MGIGALKAVIDFVYPEKCIFCGKLQRFSGERICPLCENEFTGLAPPYCVKCGRHLDGEKELCADCAGRDFLFDRCAALWPYEGKYARVVLDLKYNRALENGRTLGGLSAIKLIETGLCDDTDIIAPVPLNWRRMRKRGYNQSELIASEIGRRLKIPVCTDLLKRIKRTAPQMGLNLEQRYENIKGAFDVNKHRKISGKKVLLIDDIFTTGATLNECALELKNREAACVNGFCICTSYDFAR